MAAWLEGLQQDHSAPGVKQQLAAVRMLFDWLIIGQVVPINPVAAVRDLRDRALIATVTYSFAPIGAALKMKVEDLQSRGAGWTVRLHEKGGKHHVMPCHHALPRRCTPT